MKYDPAKMQWINHIDAHAASAYFVSPFDEAAILIAEGGTGIYHGQDLDLNIVGWSHLASKNDFQSPYYDLSCSDC